jgi:hypothetical protein
MSTLSPAPVAAFGLREHEGITETALGGLVDEYALSRIVGSFYFPLLFGTGNLGSDRDQEFQARHYDSAPDRKAICDRWRDGQRVFVLAAAQWASPSAETAFTKLANRELALDYFGQATHSLQDFYSHSNWVENRTGSGQPLTPSPLVAGCDEEELPRALETGFYDGSWRNGGPLRGCPFTGPPEGFAYCHSKLNKDTLFSFKGGQMIKGIGWYHEVASKTAVEATRELWLDFVRRLEASITPATMLANGKCVVRKLAFGGSESCLDVSGEWTASGAGVIVVKPDWHLLHDGSRVYSHGDVGSCGTSTIPPDTFLDLTVERLAIRGSVVVCDGGRGDCPGRAWRSLPTTGTLDLEKRLITLNLQTVWLDSDCQVLRPPASIVLTRS